MLSNLSDLLMSRVDPNPVQAPSQTSMVAMSPQSQAQAMQQQATPAPAAPPAQAKYLQAGQPVKDFNAMTANMSADNPQGDTPSKYQSLLKGDYTAVRVGQKGAKNIGEALGVETPEMQYKRFLMDHDYTGERLDRALWVKEQSEAKKAELKAKGLSNAQVEKQVNEYLKTLSVD